MSGEILIENGKVSENARVIEKSKLVLFKNTRLNIVGNRIKVRKKFVNNSK